MSLVNDLQDLSFNTCGGQESGPRVLKAGELSLSLAGCRPIPCLGNTELTLVEGGTGELDQWA